MYKVGDIIKKEVTQEVAGEYDVIVCGGGTAGCAAAIAAAREGARVLLLEASPFLGGMLTEGNAGLTNFVYNGKDADVQTKITQRLRTDPGSAQVVGGIPLEIAHALLERKAALGTAGTAGTYVYTDCQEFKILLFEMLKKEGVEILLHSPVCDVIMDGRRIEGVVTQTKLGRKIYLGKQIIDTTGDGDVAVLAGVDFALGVCEDDSVYKQGLMKQESQHAMGAMFRIGGVDFDQFIEYIKAHPEAYRPTRAGLMTLDEMVHSYDMGEMINFLAHKKIGWFQVYNYPRKGIMVGCISMPDANADGSGDHLALNGLLEKDVTFSEYEIMLRARKLVDELRESVPGFAEAFVVDTPRVGIRETRHIIGEYRLNITDILNRVEFEDAIGKGSHPIDVHPVPKEVKNAEKPEEWSFEIPYRCMVPKKVDNLLVAGRCVSATREGYGCIRPTAQCMVLGEAAGTAAAILFKDRTPKAGDISIEKLRNTLKRNHVVL